MAKSVEHREYLQRDPAQGGKVRVVHYRLETPVDTWFNTQTGTSVEAASTTQPEQLVRVSSEDPSTCNLDPLSAEQRAVVAQGWSPPEPVLLRLWIEVTAA